MGWRTHADGMRWCLVDVWPAVLLRRQVSGHQCCSCYSFVLKHLAVACGSSHLIRSFTSPAHTSPFPSSMPLCLHFAHAAAGVHGRVLPRDAAHPRRPAPRHLPRVRPADARCGCQHLRHQPQRRPPAPRPTHGALEQRGEVWCSLALVWGAGGVRLRCLGQSGSVGGFLMPCGYGCGINWLACGRGLVRLNIDEVLWEACVWRACWEGCRVSLR